MKPGITLSLHLWRGIGPDVQRDLFWARYRLGFVTLAIERNDTLVAYRILKAAIEERIAADEANALIDHWEEGR